MTLTIDRSGILHSAFPRNARQSSAQSKTSQSLELTRLRKSGLGLFVKIHVEVDGDLTVRHDRDIAHQVSDLLQSSSLSVSTSWFMWNLHWLLLPAPPPGVLFSEMARRAS